MAIIPRTKENQRIQPNAPVPIGSTAFAGAQGKALAGFGEQIAQYGKQLNDTSNRIQLEQGKNEISNLYQQAYQEAERGSAPDGSDMRQKFDESVDSKIGAVRDKYGGFGTNQQLDSFQKMAREDLYTNIQGTQLKKQEQYNVSNIEGLQTTSTQRIFQNPDRKLLQAEMVNHTKLIQDIADKGGVSAGNAAKLTKTYYNQMGESLVKGMMLRKQYPQALNMLSMSQETPGLTNSMDPEEAQKLGFITSQEGSALKSSGKMYEIPVMTKGPKMKLTNEEAVIMNSLDPNIRENLSQQLQAKIKETTAIRLGDLSAKLEGYKVMALSGKPQDQRQFDAMRQEVLTNPNLTPDARLRKMDDLNTYRAVNEQLQLAYSQPKMAAEDIVKGMDQKVLKLTEVTPGMARANSDFATLGGREQAKNQLRAQLDSLYKERDKDPAQFFRQTDTDIDRLYRASRDAGRSPEGAKALEQYNDALLNKAKYLGTPGKILSAQENAEFAKTMKSIPDAENTDKYIGSLQGTFGKHFTRAMSEVIANDPDMAPYAAVIYADPQNRTNLIDGIKNSKTIDKEFAAGGQYAEYGSIVNDAVRAELQPFRKVMVSGHQNTGNLQVVQGLEKAVAIQTKREMVNSGLDVSTAAKKAYGQVIDTQYMVVEGGKNTILVPRKVGTYTVDKPDQFERFMNTYSAPNKLNELNILVPEKEFADTRTTGKATADIVKEKGVGAISTKNITDNYYEKLAPRVRWVTNQGQTGVRMMEQMIDGSLKSVYDKTGKAIEKSYEDIYTAPNEGMSRADRKKFVIDNTGFGSKL